MTTKSAIVTIPPKRYDASVSLFQHIALTSRETSRLEQRSFQRQTLANVVVPHAGRKPQPEMQAVGDVPTEGRKALDRVASRSPGRS